MMCMPFWNTNSDVVSIVVNIGVIMANNACVLIKFRTKSLNLLTHSVWKSSFPCFSAIAPSETVQKTVWTNGKSAHYAQLALARQSDAFSPSTSSAAEPSVNVCADFVLLSPFFVLFKPAKWSAKLSGCHFLFMLRPLNKTDTRVKSTT